LFTRELKAEIVELCQRGDWSVGQVARDVDLGLPELRHGTRAVAQQVPGEPAAVGAAELHLLGLVHHCRGPGRVIDPADQEPAEESFHRGSGSAGGRPADC